MIRSSLFRAIGVAALLIFLVFGGPPDKTIFWDALFDVGHAALFGVVTFFLLGIAAAVRPNARDWQIAVFAFSVSAAFGAGTEIIQIFDPNRDASVSDFMRDISGASICLALWLSMRVPPAQVRRAGLLRIAAAVIALATVVTFLQVVANYVQRDRAFPVLLRLNGSSWEQQFVRFNRSHLQPDATVPTNLSHDNTPYALLALLPGTFPGFVINEPHPDWRGYQFLTFSIVSTDTLPLTIRLRVHDRGHDGRFGDRFNQLIEIHPGLQEVRVALEEIRRAPVGRSLDLANVGGVAIYAYQLERPAEFYISELHLE